MLIQRRDDVLGAQGVLAGPRSQPQYGRLRIVPSKGNVASDGVGVRRERVVLDDDAVADGRGPVEARKEQVHVDRQRVHHDDLARLCPDEPSRWIAQRLVIANPGTIRVGMAVHPVLLPGIEIGHELGSRRARLQARASCRQGTP